MERRHKIENSKLNENQFIEAGRTALVVIDLQNGIVNRELSLTHYKLHLQ